MNKIIALLAPLLIALGLMTPVPAQASPVCDYGVSCGYIGHYSPNSGYDAPIFIICNWGDAFYPGGEPRPWSVLVEAGKFVKEGEKSSKYCHDTDVVVVRNNEQIACRETDRFGNHYWPVKFDSTGPHKIYDTFVERWCVTQRD